MEILVIISIILTVYAAFSTSIMMFYKRKVEDIYTTINMLTLYKQDRIYDDNKKAAMLVTIVGKTMNSDNIKELQSLLKQYAQASGK